MSNDHSNPHSQQHLHKKQHKNSHGNPLPHLKDAAHPDTGKVDQAALIAGSEAWKEAIQSGEYELVSATEIGIDENTDVLVLTRRKLK